MAGYQTRKPGYLFLISLQGVMLLVILISVADAFTCNAPTDEEKEECEIERKQMAAEHPEREIVTAYCGCRPEYAGEEGEWCGVAQRRCKTGLVCADLRRGQEIDIYETWYYGHNGECSTTPIPTTPAPEESDDYSRTTPPPEDWEMWNHWKRALREHY